MGKQRTEPSPIVKTVRPRLRDTRYEHGQQGATKHLHTAVARDVGNTRKIMKTEAVTAKWQTLGAQLIDGAIIMVDLEGS